ncbi:MAG: acetyl-CoA carboxylase carboxyltransferase subunit alpha [Bacteroidetes bacterium]|nr:MAG: acetyl-CoA carboxylase carboxyltransferase subunit alpha [Bacteroidota bacterium]
MVFLEFEKPLESLYEQLEKIKQVGEQGDLDVSPMIRELEQKIRQKKKEIYENLTGWQKVQLSRHPERPYTLFYIRQMCKKFIELHGDRCFRDDKAIVGGIGNLDGRSVVLIGHQKGVNTKMRQYRNFGMAYPEGYRKALRLMKLAERFGFPVVTLIDTPGAYPGIEAEERGQAEAIARNLFEMAQLRVPIVCIVIGEGASGGAIGIGVGDRVYMLENTWYSVISPESCSSILWRSWDYKEQAAEALKLTADHMYEFGLIDGIIKEPLGGAHSQPEEMAKILKRHIKKTLQELMPLDPEERIRQRIEKYASMGVYDVLEKAATAASKTSVNS